MMPNASAAQPTQANGDCRRRRVLAAQLRLLYGNANVGVGVTLVATSLLGRLQWEVVAHPIVLSWCLYMGLVAAGRFTLARRYWRRAPSSLEPRRWRAGFVLGAGLAGIGWGAAGILLYPEGRLVNQLFLVFMLGGMMLGAASVFAARPEAYLAFIVPAGLAPAARLAFRGDEAHLAMASMAGLFTLATLITTRRIHLTIASLNLQFENAALVENLQAATQRAEALNEQLEVRVRERAAELHRSTQQLREQAALLELAPVLVRDLEGRIVRWTQGAQRLYGFSKDEALGRMSHELFQTQFPESKGHIEEALRGAGRWEGELVHRKRNGGQLVVASQQIVYRDAGGQPARILEVNADLTERKAAEQALRESQARLAGIIDSAMDAIITIDEAQRVVLFNAAAERMFGCAAPEALGQPLERFIPAPLRAAHRAHVRAFAEAGVTRRAMGQLGHLTGLRADGTTFPFEASISQITAGQAKLFTAIVRDATERRRAEQLQAENVRLEEASRRFEEANRLKSEFLAHMSHELRTPLNAILGFTELLIDGRTGPLNPTQAEYLNDVHASARHLLDLITDVLDLARVEAGKLGLHLATFRLEQTVGELCAVVDALARERGLTLTWAVAPDLGSVTLDEQRVKQIGYNLLSNAVKFTGPGGRVELQALAYGGDRFELRVTDTGCGIKAEDLGRLFRRFEQLDQGASRCFEGTGLGLALTKCLVELQGGRIEVESQYGQGSTFKVVLPRRL
jgi:PAS domain S-box-containing protein